MAPEHRERPGFHHIDCDTEVPDDLFCNLLRAAEEVKGAGQHMAIRGPSKDADKVVLRHFSLVEEARLKKQRRTSSVLPRHPEDPVRHDDSAWLTLPLLRQPGAARELHGERLRNLLGISSQPPRRRRAHMEAQDACVPQRDSLPPEMIAMIEALYKQEKKKITARMQTSQKALSAAQMASTQEKKTMTRAAYRFSEHDLRGFVVSDRVSL